MPIIKSAKKRVRVSESKAAVNQKHRAGSKTAVRTATRAIAADSPEAPILVQQAASRLDRASAQGSIHRNKAARLKSRLAAKLKGIMAETPKAKATTKATEAKAKAAPKAKTTKAKATKTKAAKK